MCLLRAKRGSIITGWHYNTIHDADAFEMSESAYDNDAAFVFSSRAVLARETPFTLQHCSIWEIEDNHGLLATYRERQKESKT
eukprot:14329605-Ditylum_brightwellii.AAC.1